MPSSLLYGAVYFNLRLEIQLVYVGYSREVVSDDQEQMVDDPGRWKAGDKTKKPL